MECVLELPGLDSCPGSHRWVLSRYLVLERTLEKCHMDVTRRRGHMPGMSRGQQLRWGMYIRGASKVG